MESEKIYIYIYIGSEININKRSDTAKLQTDG